jgi:hypothetical protein
MIYAWLWLTHREGCRQMISGSILRHCYIYIYFSADFGTDSNIIIIRGRMTWYSYFFNSNSGGWSPTGSSLHVGHRLVYCTCPGWLWGTRIWWNDNWQGEQKYSEKTCPSATLSTTNPIWPDRVRTQAATVGSQRLTAWAMARPRRIIIVTYSKRCFNPEEAV